MAGAGGRAMIRWMAVVLLAAGGTAMAAAPYPSDIDPARFSYQERAGARLPGELLFRDSDGQAVRLGDLAQGAPLILVPAYFRCSNLCGVVRANLLGALQRADLHAGRDYVLAVLSIDPTETSAEASAAKADDLSAFGGGQAMQPYWHYLTGTPSAITAATEAVGFRHRFDFKSQQFIHPAGIVFVSAQGIVSNYLLGVGYTPVEVRSALHSAGVGRIAAAAAPLLLVCFHFDPTTGRYSLEILKVLRLAGVLTVLTLAGVIFLLFRKERLRS